jgi:putative peptide zinc metalloprotease protein
VIRRLLVILAALALMGAWPAAARADDGDGGDNAAVAINTKDGSSIFRLAFKIRRVAGDIVDNTNAAVAFNQCERCESTAIAIQIVLVTGSASVVTPENVAVAINQQCTLCVAFASAYQFVVSTGGPVRFTAEGLQELAAIRRELRALRDADVSPFELQQRIDALMDRLRTVLRTQLVPAGSADEAQGDEEDVSEGERPTRGSTTAPTTTPTTTVTDTGETVTTEPAETAPTTTETTPTTTAETTTPTP